MTEDPTSSRSQLRQEAATWFAIMRGPEAETRRAEFEKWFRRDASHRRAYNSISETFTLGKLLKDDCSPPSTPIPHTPRFKVRSPSRRKAQTVAAVLAFGVGISAAGLRWHATTTASDQTVTPIADAAAESDREARYATTIGEVRNFALPGGTRVILDTDSLVLASFTPSESSLRLIKGRARFFTDRGPRTLVVRADTIVIRAKDAVYDVALATDTHVTVKPIIGHVDVQYGADAQAPASRSTQGAAISTAHIVPGERIDLEAGKPISNGAGSEGGESWPDGVEQFNAISLSNLVDDANRYAVKPIRLSDPGVANAKISGTFHLADTKRLAQRIAQLLDLQADNKRDMFLLRSTCPETTEGPCPTPS